jgi:hypothetical protein
VRPVIRHVNANQVSDPANHCTRKTTDLHMRVVDRGNGSAGRIVDGEEGALEILHASTESAA